MLSIISRWNIYRRPSPSKVSNTLLAELEPQLSSISEMFNILFFNILKLLSKIYMPSHRPPVPSFSYLFVFMMHEYIDNQKGN